MLINSTTSQFSIGVLLLKNEQKHLRKNHHP